MLLFSDGFETYNIYDIRYKWGYFGQSLPYPTYTPSAKIVAGTDTSCNKPWATKDGRALYLSKDQACLNTTFKPSRTIITGFAFRCRCPNYVDVRITFGTKEAMDRGRADGMSGDVPPVQYVQTLTYPVGILDLRIYRFRISYTWTFTGSGIPPQVADINTSMDLLSGDYHYIQVGMTLSGNVSMLPEAWCELRVGNNPSGQVRHQNILTSRPDGAGYFYMNALSFNFNRGMDYYSPAYTTVDDFYILNDEGAVNNTFLGNVKVRRVTPSADGADNSAVPTLKTGDARRFQAVDEDFAGGNAMPYPAPTPEQDPLFLPWEPQFEDYLTLENRSDRQSLRFHSVNFAGSSPYIHGAILHGLAKSKYMGLAGQAALKAYRRSGLLPLIEANPVDLPLSAIRPSGGSWQDHPMTFDNNEFVAPGQYPQIWNPSILNDSEWVIELVDSPLEPEMYDQNLLRFNLTSEEICAEFLGFIDFSHRYYDASVAETIAITETAPLYERTFKIAESLYWAPEISIYRTFQKSVNSELRLDEAIPWVYLFAQGQLTIADELFLEWHDQVEEEIVVEDWSTGFWEEMFDDSIDITDAAAASFIERLEEMFGLEEPYLWDGHEDVEEILEINVSYVWDNHELMEEYFYPDDAVAQGIGLDIEDGFGLEADHFDGWLVEENAETLRAAVSILTQHWRYERFFGIVISSWQIDPVEQQGQDGNHNGDNPWGW